MDSMLNMTRTLSHGCRNSRIEVLRLLAMFAITLNHFPWDYSMLSAGGSEGFAAQFIVNLLSNFGGVGDCLFFGISAWYLSGEARGGGSQKFKAYHQVGSSTIVLQPITLCLCLRSPLFEERFVLVWLFV